MTRSALLGSTVLALVGGLVVAACSDDALTAGGDPEVSLAIQAHTPAHHGSSAAAALAAAPDYAGLDGAAAEVQGGGGLRLTADASGDIPRFPDAFISSVAVFGYAWADLQTGQGIVAVIHPAIGRDSRQNPDGWHTHPVQLAGGTKPTGTSDFCIVSIGTSQAGITLQGGVIGVHMPLQWAGISASALDVAASFVVQPDAGCSATGLGVVLLDTATL